MRNLVSAELLKLRTTRTAFGFLVAIVLLSLAVTITTLAVSSFTDKEDVVSVLSGAGFAAGLLLVLGIVGTTGEFRHNTITPSLLATPERWRLVVAKLIAYLIAGAVLGAAAIVVTFIIGIPWLLAKDAPLESLGAGDYLGIAARGIALAALSGAIGVAIGSIVRNQVAAVVGTLIYLFVLEPLVTLASSEVASYTIGGAQGALGEAGMDDELAPVLAGLVLGAWAAVLAAIGITVEQNRDVT